MAVMPGVGKVRKAWAVYAAALSLAVVIGELSNLGHGEQIAARTVVNWIVTAVLLVATWAYALQKPLGSEQYWRTAFWVVLFAGVVTLVPVAIAGGVPHATVLILLACVVPAYVAAYGYAFHSSHLWVPRKPRD